MKTLVLVAGHAIPYRFDRLDRDEGWYLKPFQTGEGSFYLDHEERGVAIATQHAGRLLVFAGGQTDAAAGPRSEGQGYWLAADHFDRFGHREVRGRATTEEFSLDSFQNLLYGIWGFREVTNRYPDRIIAVGLEFKGARFDLHRRALRFPIHASSTRASTIRQCWRRTCRLRESALLSSNRIPTVRHWSR